MRSDPRSLSDGGIDGIPGAETLRICQSTNDVAKGFVASGLFDRFVIASSQTKGRGSRDRLFISNPGGIYMSYSFMPGVNADEFGLYVLAAGVAVCRTLAGFGFDPRLKYPNDVVLNGKKVCGILMENVFGERSGSVLGLGLNVYNDISMISDIACSLSLINPEFCAPLGNLAAVLADEIRSVCKDPRRSLGEYRRLCITLGQEVVLIALGEKTRGIAEDFDESGRLVICTQNNVRVTACGGETVISGAAYTG